MLRASARVRPHRQNERVGVVRNIFQARTVCLNKASVDNREKGLMFLILFIVLLVIWLLGWAAFHIAGGLIHLLPHRRRHFAGSPFLPATAGVIRAVDLDRGSLAALSVRNSSRA
jgi:hypothetical protein